MDNLMIDFYEFTMGQAYFNENKKDNIAYFDLFFRKCPDNASFVIANGIDKCLEFLKNFHFEKKEIEYLRSLNIFTEEYLARTIYGDQAGISGLYPVLQAG